MAFRGRRSLRVRNALPILLETSEIFEFRVSNVSRIFPEKVLSPFLALGSAVRTLILLSSMKFLVVRAGFLESAGPGPCWTWTGCSGLNAFLDFACMSLPSWGPCSDFRPADDSISSLTGKSEVLTGFVCAFGISARDLDEFGPWGGGTRLIILEASLFEPAVTYERFKLALRPA